MMSKYGGHGVENGRNMCESRESDRAKEMQDGSWYIQTHTCKEQGVIGDTWAEEETDETMFSIFLAGESGCKVH